ncbi:MULTISPECIES: hypothetical protein [unclassified Lysobacter]|jgi:hypothetical protein|uniref:hypothetical protein n=1 Tax=unclassified Lysobacter TaxID=2635362 RepID=UPI001F58C8D1|nr:MULTISPECIES: hypothetical protein [unclassified Lysobacter]HEX5663304.1 hypothetical protein [Xanthomonadaceae bacterium]
MNAKTQTPANASSNVIALNARRERRERDFGIGYGNSSGYASSKRYTNDWGLTRFRCA